MSNQKYNIQTILLGKNHLKEVMKAECFHDGGDGITIEVWAESDEKDKYAINLDKWTAIKFAKELRTEINKIEL